MNNETEGNSFEVAICEIKNIPYNDKIKSNRYDQNIVNEMKEFLSDKYLPDVIEYIGNKTINGKKSKIDFVDSNGKTYSAKSNKSKYPKICPQVIGQPTKKMFCEYFGLENLKISEIKKLIYLNISKIISEYWKNLFCCDVLIWIKRDQKNKFKLDIYEKERMLNQFLNLDNNLFSWSNSLKKWNEGITLKWNNQSLAVEITDYILI
jgi:hypothetical protein